LQGSLFALQGLSRWLTRTNTTKKKKGRCGLEDTVAVGRTDYAVRALDKMASCAFHPPFPPPPLFFLMIFFFNHCNPLEVAVGRRHYYILAVRDAGYLCFFVLFNFFFGSKFVR
jgi:hypothetical protein